MDEHENMQKLGACRGIIKRRGNPLVLAGVPHITEDQKERADPFSFAQGKFTDAFIKRRIDKLELIILLDTVHEGREALVDVFL